MGETLPRYMSAAVLARLNALAEKRCAYFTELDRTGRWALFYSEDQFAACLREVMKLADASRAMLDAARADSAAGSVPAQCEAAATP